MNLKYNYPIIVFALAFAAAIYLSFRHEPLQLTDTVSATPQERMDQINLSAMHADPTPLTSTFPNASSSSSSAALPPPVTHATASDLAKLSTLEQVLASHNDNDLRLDRDLRALSPAAKALMRGRYASTSAEKRNQRGTIVHLVGRELSTVDDLQFLHSVLNEPPCLSMADCGHEERGSVMPSDHHHDSGNEVSLAYPQLVALKSIEAFLERTGGSGELSVQALAEIESARRSPVRKVASLAEEIARAYHAKHP